MPSRWAIIPDLLWVGTASALRKARPVAYDCVVSAADAHRPPNHPGLETIWLQLVDAPWVWQMDKAASAVICDVAREVAIHASRGKRVLVACRDGRNCSCLVVGLALRSLGRSRWEAYSQIMSRRGQNALSNSSFLDAVFCLKP